MNRSTETRVDLVTGVLGFAGLHLVRELLATGATVVGLDRRPDRQAPPLSAGAFIREEARRPDGSWFFAGPVGGFAVRDLSVEDGDALVAVIAAVRPRRIYHLAAQSSAAASFEAPRATLETNLLGTLNVLEAVRALPAAERPTLLAVGSAEEYGRLDGDAAPLSENAPSVPVSPYAVSKAAQTLLCRQYHLTYGIPVVIARPFSHTGPGQQPRFAFPSFARQIAAAEKGVGPAEILTGDLSPVRDFLDVRDVVRAYRQLAECGRPGEIYNVCSGTPLTMEGGLRILVAAAAVPITVRRDPSRLRPADAPYLVGDNRKLRTDTGWAPERDMASALRDLLEETRKEFP